MSRPGPRRSRLAVAAVLALGAALTGGLLAPAASAAPRVIVSLTFDDGFANQLGYLATLQRYGLPGTFYVNTGAIGQPGYLTRDGLARIAAAGEEIGGHTVSHADLPATAPDETARQICDDRATLAAWGYPTTSFAYPFGAYDDRVEAAARGCGYASARRVGGLGAPGRACPECEAAESVPAVDPFALRSFGEATSASTLAEFQGAVAAATRAGGDWVPFVFHREACESCGDLSTSPALLDTLGAWLVDQQRAGRLAVRTVGQVVGARPAPIVTAPRPAGTSVGNASLEGGADPAVPDCWMRAGFGANTAGYARVPDAHGGRWAETVTVTEHRDGDAKVLPRLDLGQCTAPAAAGGTYALSAWYHSTTPTQFAVYRRSGTGAWTYWTSSPWFGPTPTWAPATWAPPPAPPDTTGLAAGLVLSSVGSLTTDDYGIAAVAPPPPPPLLPAGFLGPLSLVAVAVTALGLLAALVGLVHHLGTRKRRWRRYEGHGPVPAPRPSGSPSKQPAGSSPEPPSARAEPGRSALERDS